jgi:[protein-PII] uridylyltransferase
MAAWYPHPASTLGPVSTLTTERAVAAAWEQRLAALADTTVGGREFCHRLSQATDMWITALAAHARAEHPRAPRFALVAVGGYGRGELSPFSDIDLLLVHQSKSNKPLESVASAIWYPIWDAGLKLGHAVRNLEEHLELAKGDLDTATALLTARPLAGDPKLGAAIVDSGRANWTRRKKRWLSDLQRRVRTRQSDAGDVAYMLEPDLKDGHGGIRDAHSLWWAERGGLALPEEDDVALNDCYDVLLNARVALHRATGRPGDTLSPPPLAPSPGSRTRPGAGSGSAPVARRRRWPRASC